MGEKDKAGLLQALVQHYAALAQRLTRRLGSSTAAMDAVQDTYIRLQGLEAVPELSNPKAYLYRVADNVALERLRREASRRYEPLPDALQALEPGPEASARDRQRLARLAEAVDELPPRCREVFLLHKFDGLGYAEVAARLGISRSAVEKQIMKALAHCRDRLAE